jgi:hypothetical protein
MSRLSVVFVLLLAGVAAGQEPLKPIALTLHAPKPSPRKLQYPLLVPASDQVPGNAVTHYKEANEKHSKLIKDEGFQPYQEKIDAWGKLPLDELPRKDMAEFFEKYRQVYVGIDAGAHCDHADWEHLEGLRTKGIAATLGEDIQRVRRLIQLLSVRARFYMAEGKIELAIKDLQSGYTMGRHICESPTLIGSLVGLALTNIMTERLDELLQQPGVPALYWSLGEMPGTQETLRRPMQAERLSGYGSFPGIFDAVANLDAGPITADQVQGCVKTLLLINRIEQQPLAGPRALLNEVRLGLAINQKHETAKKALIAQGRPKDKVEAMPHVQVALLHALPDYDRVLDEIIVAVQLPPWEALPQIRQWNKTKMQELDRRPDAPAIPLATNFVPAVEKVYRAHLRTDRRFAAQRCVEALRLYAAAHDGRFPASLKEIKDVHIPIDPGTGKDFQYKLRDDKATLTAPPLGNETNTYPFALAYELTYQR